MSQVRMRKSNYLLHAISLALIVAAPEASSGQQQQQQQQVGAVDSPLISPSPRDYLAFYKRACEESSSSRRPSGDELAATYANESALGSLRLSQLAQKMRLDRECRREPSAWRYRYIDENGSVQIRDDSIEERLANVVYTTRTIKAFAIDSLMYDSGDKQVDAKNMELAAGSRVNDELCAQQLKQMLRLLDELATLNKQLAAGQPAILTDQHLSVAKVLDSFGRYSPGFLYGRTMAMGAYEQCQRNRLIVSHTSGLGMRYCWAHLNLAQHLDGSLAARHRDQLETETDVISTGICIPETCHSKSFHKHKALFAALVSSQFKLPTGLYANETLPLNSLYCLVDADSRFKVPLFGKLLLSYTCFWLLLTILVTLHRVKHNRRSRDGQRNSLLANFDLMDSWSDFLQARERADATKLVELNTINVVKALGSLFVVLAHSLALFIGFSLDEIHSAKVLETEPIMLLMVCASMIVDTFFAISGILWAFFTLKRLHRQDNAASGQLHLSSSNDCDENGVGKLHAGSGGFSGERGQNSNGKASVGREEFAKSSEEANYFVNFEGPAGQARGRKPTDGLAFFCKNWITLTLFRYLRITPLFVLIHWFKKFVFIYAGSGPLWDHGFNSRSFSGSCRQESMWTPLTFMSAYYPLSHQCTLQSWSISNDMFFSLLAPAIIMLVYKRARLAIWLSLLACFASFLSAQWAISQTPAAIDEELRELRSWGFYRFFDKVSTLYTAPHYRIFCFLIGVWGGYFLHRYQLRESAKSQFGAAGQVGASHWPWWMRGPATWLSFAYLASILIAFVNNDLVKLHLDPYYRQIYPQFVSSIRFIWALSNTFIFLRMMTDWKDNFWMRLSSAKFWQILTKLNYPILLVHMDLLVFTLQVARAPVDNVTVWSFINLGFGVFLICVPISMLLHVVYENPFDKLIRSLLPRFLTTAAAATDSASK